LREAGAEEPVVGAGEEHRDLESERGDSVIRTAKPKRCPRNRSNPLRPGGHWRATRAHSMGMAIDQ
jgi:hypothetical protein